VLKAEQEASLRTIIAEQKPRQLKLDFSHWSRIAVLHLIEREYGIKPSLRTIGKYLQRWGLTSDKRARRPIGQEILPKRDWVSKEYFDHALAGQPTPIVQ
jgi:transposase